MVMRLFGLLVCLTIPAVPAAADRRHQSIEAVDVIWGLRQFDGMRVASGPLEPATIRFYANNAIGGTAACNAVGGQELTWTAEPSGRTGAFGRNERSATITTAVGCSDPEAAALGDRFWSRMLKARRWTTSALTLHITFADGSKAVLTPVSDTRK